MMKDPVDGVLDGDTLIDVFEGLVNDVVEEQVEESRGEHNLGGRRC